MQCNINILLNYPTVIKKKKIMTSSLSIFFHYFGFLIIGKNFPLYCKQHIKIFTLQHLHCWQSKKVLAYMLFLMIKWDSVSWTILTSSKILGGTLRVISQSLMNISWFKSGWGKVQYAADLSIKKLCLRYDVTWQFTDAGF